MKIDKVYCLFEQSGTFRDVFKDKGYDCLDVDISPKADICMDLFKELDLFGDGEPSLFSDFDENTLAFAFFPCTYFSRQSDLNVRACRFGYEKHSPLERLAESSHFMSMREMYYYYFCKLFSCAYSLKFKMVVENPFVKGCFLERYFPFEPSIRDLDRSKFGDLFKKPTGYWFVNFAPSFSFVPQYPSCASKKVAETAYGIERSVISPEYAKTFVESYILTN